MVFRGQLAGHSLELIAAISISARLAGGWIWGVMSAQLNTRSSDRPVSMRPQADDGHETHMHNEEFHRYLLREVSAEAAEVYRRFHPPPALPPALPPAPVDLVGALADVRAPQRFPAETSRHRMRLTCGQEARMEHAMLR